MPSLKPADWLSTTTAMELVFPVWNRAEASGNVYFEDAFLLIADTKAKRFVCQRYS